MKYYFIREWDHDELFTEWIVRGDNIDDIVKTYVNFRIKNYQEELTIKINKEPNKYGIYSGHASVIFEGEEWLEYELTMTEVKFKDDILDLN